MSTGRGISIAREPSGRAGVSTTPRAPQRVHHLTESYYLPRQSLDDRGETNSFAPTMAPKLNSPSSAMSRWLGDLPDDTELGPNEHFAVGEYDDENGYRRSAMFVYESVGEQQAAADDYPDWTHPRTPPLPPTVPTRAFEPSEFLRVQTLRHEAETDLATSHPQFKITPMNGVKTGKIILKRFAKTAGKVLDKCAPEHTNTGVPTSRAFHPSISSPTHGEHKDLRFPTITIAEAQAREKARIANFERKQAAKPAPQPLEKRQIGNTGRETQWMDFATYTTPPPERGQSLPSLPCIPEHINRPSRKAVPEKKPRPDLNKSLPPSPDTDSLRRRTQMPPNAGKPEAPDILAVPAMKAVVNHRNAVVSQYGLVMEEASTESEENISWPGTPANFDASLKNKPLWWQFEGSAEELDPTQVVWKRMEESLRNGGGIRCASGISRSHRYRGEE